MKHSVFVVVALSSALVACQRSAPPESNPQPVDTGEAASVPARDAAPAAPQAIPALAYAEQTDTMPAGQTAPYAVTVTNGGSDASSLRVVWQWLDAAGAPVGRPTTVEPGLAQGEGLVRFNVRAPNEVGEHMLKVWLARTSGESLEPQGSQPLHYRVQVAAPK